MLRPFALVALSALALTGCPKKPSAPPPPIVGWQQLPEQSFACFHPPVWGGMNETERRQARPDSLDEMMSQWNGSREDGVTFDEGLIEDVEITLLGRPVAIEGVVNENLAQCKKAVASGDTGPWQSWLKALPGRLTEGECLTPFTYTMFDYLDIGAGWQRTMPICEGDVVRVTGSQKDRYRIADDGPWITVEGDLNRPTLAGEDPCNFEGCFAGMLVLRFVSDQGIETIFPVGAQMVFTAPAHGEISYRINDTVYYDNTWYTGGGIEDHTSIEISAVE